MMRLHTKAVALSSGIVLGGIVVVKTVLALYAGYAPETLEIMMGWCPGYTISPVGVLIGFLYGFLKGAVTGGVFAYLYNKIFVRI